jgi:hypothetical protein
MGSIKVGDLIIITDALTSRTIPDLRGSIAMVLFIDDVLLTYPYKIKKNGMTLWVEGVPYSPLIAELF